MTKEDTPGPWSLARALALTEKAGGHAVTLHASGRGPQDAARLRDRDLTARDVFGTPEAARAGERLKQCAAACEDYTERVFTALHETPDDNR